MRLEVLIAVTEEYRIQEGSKKASKHSARSWLGLPFNPKLEAAYSSKMIGRLGCMFILYFTLVRSKVEYASVVWNSITSTDANKLERIQQKFSL
jgi:hypothetical protein